MNYGIRETLHYWRASLADSALGRGCFGRRDEEKFIRLSEDALQEGVLPQPQIVKAFEGQPKEAEVAPVLVWPLVAARKHSHGLALSDGYPEIVAPVVTEATVDREGIVRPSRVVIARDVLTPLPDDVFSLGSVEDFDAFLTKTPFQPDETSPIWPQYLAYVRAMVDAVAPGWPAGDDHYLAAEYGFLQPSGTFAATIRNVIRLYDALIDEEPATPLLETLAGPPAPLRDLSPETEARFVNRLGHYGDEFPLADHQRQVLSYLSTGETGEVLAVNGPPGSGKTTMLLSAIADAWVRAALAESEPPVIVAASSNNQAVTNIIDAFGKDFGAGAGPFAGRWLPGIKSYGLYLPAKSRMAEASRLYQTETFFERLETREYLAEAEEAYLLAGRAAFPELDNPDVREIVGALHERITEQVLKLSDADEARLSVERATAKVADLLGEDAEAALPQLEAAMNESAEALARRMMWEAGWARRQARESIFMAIFDFIPVVARKRLKRGRVALDTLGCTLDLSAHGSVTEVELALEDEVRSAKRAAEAARISHEDARLALEELTRAQAEWEAATASLGAPSEPAREAVAVDRFADCHTRFHLFQLACHYWEGRWLLEMEAHVDEIVEQSWQTKPSAVRRRWRRRMMLTPCAVSTFYALPAKLRCWRPEGDGYLFGFIDLLIVDEAGQVLPEVAAPSFALAKRALVIGDTRQIAPIASLSSAVDIGNLRSAGLLGRTWSDADLTALSERGVRSVDGSAMRVAQQACAFAPYPELDRGLYLFEHRRCYDEIIGFCNRLCYKGRLKPKRGRAPEDRVAPAMGYLHIDGLAVSHGGSRANATEAATIADWLAENRTRLERHYDRKLEEIVGVVTPFGRQVLELKRACARRQIHKDMTIGTVHALQGAERPVVLFSPVYSKHANGDFIDMSPSMLNVTVSRAKDSFLVFGDMDVFTDAARGKPRAALAASLYARKDGALTFPAQPRCDLKEPGRPLATLRDAEEHDRFLIDAVSSARHVTIVSPWIIASTMRRAGLLDAFGAAAARGAEIDVFVDPLLNARRCKSGPTQLEMARAALFEVGVSLREVRQLHSKIVIVDDQRLCTGSYNWLSADRNGRYARHETSLVYSGAHLHREIDVIRKSLVAREAH